jgi:hypothetical protein
VLFLVAYLLTSVWQIQHDVYYLVYFVVSISMFAAYVRASDLDVAELLRQRVRSSLVIGAASAGFVVWSVLARIDSTPHPAGPYFAFEIVWRGALYGVTDALLLSAFPGLVALALLRGNIAGLKRRFVYAILTLTLVVIITVTYHLGYEELRGKNLVKPLVGNVVISVPVVVTANPLGSFVAHVGMHLAAVTHAYESKDRLPPQVFVR